MINPNNTSDRSYYGEILSPPIDYQLDFAIGTTYSLDLDALVGASIFLGLSDDIDSDLMDNQIYLLEALRSTSNKVALFCENGQIKVPPNPTKLYILLENMVYQVKTSKYLNNRYASFHPKFWLLRYYKEETIIYRIVVLSRNLTFDRSWDISFTMDGYKKDKTTNKNDAIIQFIDYLTDFTTDELKTNKMKEIIDELKYIEFDLDSKDFVDFEFFVNGIGDDFKIQNAPLFKNDSLTNLMIISPFLSKDVISCFNNKLINSSEALFFTRLNSITPLKIENCRNFDIYTLKDDIIDGESLFSEEVHEMYKQDIHAKIYVTENKKFTELYLGSLNASHNALYGNVELMIKLQGKKNRINIADLAEDLFNNDKGGSKCPFQLINVEEYNQIEESEEDSYNLLIKYISRLNSVANITRNNNEYDIELIFKDLDENKIKDFEISIKPLLSNKKCDFSNKIIFEKLSKLSLSEFFVINIDNKLSRIIKIPTTGMPMDRQEDIISYLIKKEEDFIKYVAFLLGDEFILSIDNNFVGNSGNGFSIQLPELYEKMLRAAIYSPEKFNEIKFLIDSLSEGNVIPDGFEELYNTFIEVLD